MFESTPHRSRSLPSSSRTGVLGRPSGSGVTATASGLAVAVFGLAVTALCLMAALTATPAVAQSGDEGRGATSGAEKEAWGSSADWTEEEFFEKDLFNGQGAERGSREQGRAGSARGRASSRGASPPNRATPERGGPPAHSNAPAHARSHAPSNGKAVASGARGATTGRPEAEGYWPWPKWDRGQVRPRFAYWQTVRVRAPGRRYRRPLRVRTEYHYRVRWANAYRAHVEIRIDAIEIFEGRRFVGVVDRIPRRLSQIRAVVDRDYGTRFDRELMVVGASDLGFELVATRPYEGSFYHLDFYDRSTVAGRIDLYSGRVVPVRRSRLLRRAAFTDLTPVSIVPREADWLYRTDRWERPRYDRWDGGGWGFDRGENRYDDRYDRYDWRKGRYDRRDDRRYDRREDRDEDRYERREDRREDRYEQRDDRGDDRRDDREDRFERREERREEGREDRRGRDRDGWERGDDWGERDTPRNRRDPRWVVPRDGRRTVSDSTRVENRRRGERPDRTRDGREDGRENRRQDRTAPKWVQDDRRRSSDDGRRPTFARQDTVRTTVDGQSVEIERSARVVRLDDGG